MKVQYDFFMSPFKIYFFLTYTSLLNIVNTLNIAIYVVSLCSAEDDPDDAVVQIDEPQTGNMPLLNMNQNPVVTIEKNGNSDWLN